MERLSSASASGSRRWFIALVSLWIFLLPVQFRTPYGFRFAPSDIVMIPAAFSLFFLIGKYRRGLWHPSLTALVTMFIASALVVLVLTGEITSYALYNKIFGMFVLLTSYFVVASATKDWQSILYMERIFVGAVVLHSIFGVTDYFLDLGLPFINSYTGRLSGLLVDPNAFGGLLVVAWLLLFTDWIGHRHLFGYWKGLIGIVILGLGIVLTFSRSAWLALAVGLMIAFYTKPGFLIRLAFVSAVIASVAYLALPYAFGSSWIESAATLATRRLQIDARLELISLAWLAFLDYPLFGAGLGWFYQKYGWIIHNTPMWILTEFGITGFIVYAWMIIAFISRALLAYRGAPPDYKATVWGIFLAFGALQGLSLGIEALYQRHLWFLMALISAAYVLSKRSQSWKSGVPVQAVSSD